MYRSFEHMVTSVSVPVGSFVLVSIYRSPGPCTDFMEFMSFLSFMSSINCWFTICGDFNVHVDVLKSDVVKFLSVLYPCNLKQLVTKPTYLHGHTLDLILAPQNGSYSHNLKVCDFVSDHALVKCHIDFPCVQSHQSIKLFPIAGSTVLTCYPLDLI